MDGADDIRPNGVAAQDDGVDSHSRVLKLIDFLSQYDAMRNPPVRDFRQYQLYALDSDAVPDLPAISLRSAEEDWLAVDFVELPPRPELAPELAAYLTTGTGFTAAEPPEVLTGTDFADTELEGAPAEEPDAAAHRAAAAEWVVRIWEPWAAAYKAAATAKTFYRRLFEQYQTLMDDRDTFELVWGFGRLRWAANGVNHPLFVVPVEIELREDDRLVVVPSGPLELDPLCLANLELANRIALTSRREAIEEEPFDAWESDLLREQCRDVVRMLSDQGTLASQGTATTGAPTIDTEWVLFMRRRRPDYQGFLDAMRKLYTDGVEPPSPLKAVVVSAPSRLSDGDDERTFDHEPILLPLPANEEQQRILELAQRHAGVVVQGPPGTGKSHTIANLIAHYVSYGKRVLVVAEKEQALKVLADKVPQQIRDLTVSVLGTDVAGRVGLEASIKSIQARVSGMDPKAQDGLIISLSEQLARIDSEIARTADRLLRARQSETGQLSGDWPCGPNPTPSQAAAWLTQTQSSYDRVPDPLAPEDPCPLSSAEMSEFARLIREVGTDRAQRSAFTMPDLSILPDAKTLKDRADRTRLLETQLASIEGVVLDWGRVEAHGDAGLSTLEADIDAELECARAAEEPWLQQIAATRTDPMLKAEWEAFADTVRSERESMFLLRPQVAAHTITVPATPDAAFNNALDEARTRLIKNGKLGIFGSGDAKKALAQCTVDGLPVTTADQAALCQAQISLNEQRQRLALRWTTHVAPLTGPSLAPDQPEVELGTLLDAVSQVLEQPERWQRLQTQITEAGFRAPSEGSVAALAALKQNVATAGAHFERQTLATQRRELQTYLTDGTAGARPSPTWTLLRTALDDEDYDTWDAQRAEVAELVGIAPQAVRMVELSERLATRAPIWAQRILEDPDAAGDTAQTDTIWQWRQLDVWVNDIITSDSPASLQQDLEQLATRRRSTVADLVGVRAWRRLHSNLGDHQRQALNSYLAAVKRYGKTGGKFKARWLAAIRDALNESKDAVPVWIMPTSRALTSFRPEGEAPFDVLIVDEASQLGIDSLPLLSLAKCAIVVGDDKQTSPGAVGLDQITVFNLIDDLLYEVPHARVLFNPGNSLYDLAFQKFPHPVMLREHFRCLPEIIEFSNRCIYAGQIEPLRDQRPSPTWQALGSVKVLDGYRNAGDVNPNEANAVTDLVERIVDDPAYAGMDIGVVCLLAGGQSELIRAQLFDRLGPQIIEERRIRVGDAPNFQGDERDVMIVSLVVGTDPNNPTKAIGAMTGIAGEQRINVAASRGRNQMWVVHSVEPERFPNGDLRAELIRHARDPHAVEDLLDDQLAKCDSEFERDVVRRIIGRGYRRVRTQVRVGTENHQYRIDIVVDGPTSRVAVECDGEAWHGEDRWHADRARQEVLERAGWTFVRIRGSAYYRDPEDALEPLWARLNELGIPTGDEWLQQPIPTMRLDVTGSQSAAVQLSALDTPVDSVVASPVEVVSDAVQSSDIPVAPDLPTPSSDETPVPAPRPSESGEPRPSFTPAAEQAVAHALDDGGEDDPAWRMQWQASTAAPDWAYVSTNSPTIALGPDGDGVWLDVTRSQVIGLPMAAQGADGSTPGVLRTSLVSVGGVGVAVAYVEWANSTGELVATHLSGGGPHIKRLLHGGRIGVYQEHGFRFCELRVMRGKQSGFPTAFRPEPGEIDRILGWSLEDFLGERLAYDPITTREALFSDTGKRRGLPIIAWTGDDSFAPVMTYVATRVLPLLAMDDALGRIPIRRDTRPVIGHIDDTTAPVTI